MAEKLVDEVALLLHAAAPLLVEDIDLGSAQWCIDPVLNMQLFVAFVDLGEKIVCKQHIEQEVADIEGNYQRNHCAYDLLHGLFRDFHCEAECLSK